jgi:cell division initiation protein
MWLDDGKSGNRHLRRQVKGKQKTQTGKNIMETTPNDLRQQQFEIKFRGYNPDDVEVFRELAANALEEARAKVLQLTEENDHLRGRLKHLVEIEDTLKAAVLEAQKNSESTLSVAKKEAESVISAAEREKDLIIREAQHLRDEVVADMHRRMGKLVNDINKIRFIRNNYLIQFKSLISSHTEMIDQAMTANEEEEKRHQDLPGPPKQETYESPKQERPVPPTPEPPEPPSPPESEEVPEMHVEEAKAESSESERREEVAPEEKPKEAVPQKPEPPAKENSVDDEWKQLKEQLSED